MVVIKKIEHEALKGEFAKMASVVGYESKEPDPAVQESTVIQNILSIELMLLIYIVYTCNLLLFQLIIYLYFYLFYL